MICRGFEYFDSEWERLLGERNFGPRTDGKDDSSSSSSDEDNDKKKKNVKDDEEDESDDLESKLR